MEIADQIAGSQGFFNLRGLICLARTVVLIIIEIEEIESRWIE